MSNLIHVTNPLNPAVGSKAQGAYVNQKGKLVKRQENSRYLNFQVVGVLLLLLSFCAIGNARPAVYAHQSDQVVESVSGGGVTITMDDIVMRVQANDQGVTIDHIDLVLSGTTVQSTTCGDNVCEVPIDDLSSGCYEVWITLSSYEVVVETVCIN